MTDTRDRTDEETVRGSVGVTRTQPGIPESTGVGPEATIDQQEQPADRAVGEDTHGAVPGPEDVGTLGREVQTVEEPTTG